MEVDIVKFRASKDMDISMKQGWLIKGKYPRRKRGELSD